MNKSFLGLAAALFLAAVFFPFNFSQGISVLGLEQHFTVNRESFVIFLAALFGISKGLRVLPLLAILFGSFLVGPLATSIVAAIIVYDRSQRVKSWWFLLKDIFFLNFIVCASGLSAPLAAMVTFAGVVGIAMDFEIGILSLIPAILFSHTIKGLVINEELLFGLTAVVILLHLLWVWLNGSSAAAKIWNNAAALMILVFSFLMKDHSVLPIILSTVLLGELVYNVNCSDRKQRLWFLGAVAVMLGGFPLFVSQAPTLTMVDRGLFWAIPLLPMFLFYSSFSLGDSVESNSEKEEKAYPTWALGILFVFSTNAFWWSSLFSPPVELGKFTSGDSIMRFLFDHSTEELASIDQNNLFLSAGLVILGLVLGFVLFRFYHPEDKRVKVETRLAERGVAYREYLYKISSVIPDAHRWMTEKYNSPHSAMGDLSAAVIVGTVLISVVWAIAHFIKLGGLG